MNNHSESKPHGKVYPETIPTVDNTHTVEKIGVVETPLRKETFTTTTSTSHSHPNKSKEGYGPGLPIFAAIACCIPLAGILGYLVHEPKERANTVPVLTVPASSVVTPTPVSPAPPGGSVVAPSPVGPGAVGSKIVGPGVCGPARVGIDRVGSK